MILDNIYLKKNDLLFRKFNLTIFIVAILLYVLNQYFFKSLNIWIFTFYFNDLLATIVLFSFFNTIFIVKLTNFYVLFIITVVATFIWEYVALFIKIGSVLDYWDIVAYLISFLIYFGLITYYNNYLDNNYMDN